MWYCKIIDGVINSFANSDKVPIGDGMIPLPEGLTPENVKLVDGELVKDPNFEASQITQAWTALRTERNARLAACDWTQLQDAHLSAEKKSAWADYRQALRDLPDTVTDPSQVTWPDFPQ